MDEQVRALLDQLQPVYASIRAKQARLLDLRDTRNAVAEHDRALAEERAALEAAEGLQGTLEHKAQTLENAGSRTGPVVVVPSGGRVPVGRGAAGRAMSRLDSAAASGPGTSPLGWRRPGEDRTRLRSFVGRYLRDDLRAAGGNLLTEFNTIMNSPERPVGEALALLDWDVAYCQPLTNAETSDPARWLARLEGWGAELNAYEQRLAANAPDVDREIAAGKDILKRWQERDAGPDRWYEWIEESRLQLRAKLAVAQTAIEAARERIARQQGAGQP
jgi:hypothetical protein